MTAKQPSKKIKEMMITFQDLSFEEKKKKLLLILEKLPEEDVFTKIEELIKTNNHVNDEFLVWVYEDIMLFGDGIEQRKKMHARKKLVERQKEIERLHQKEAKEKENIELDLE